MSSARWHSEPPQWGWNGDALIVTTAEKTDFWQGTYYGFHRDDGHFLGLAQSGDFTASLEFDAAYETLYDQAGLMLRTDAENWVKAGIEYSDGVKNFSVVITRHGQSDWSVIAAPDVSGPQTIRLTRIGQAIIVHYLKATGWHLMRLGETAMKDSVMVGPMTCSPERDGLQARFLDLTITPPGTDPLHAS